MKSIYHIAILLLVATAVAAETRLGKPVTLEKSTSVRELLDHPETYLGKPVRVDGEITAVCQAMGCWIEVRDDSGSSIRLKSRTGRSSSPRTALDARLRPRVPMEQYMSDLTWSQFGA